MNCTTSVTDNDLNAELQRRVRELFSEYAIPGGAAIVVGGGGAAVFTHGRVSLSGNRPTTGDTMFSVGSVAKTLVSTALAALVADAKLAWDDPLIRYVPEFGYPDAAARDRVSLRDCVANRLGLAREGFCEWGASEGLPITDLLSRLAYTPLARPLGSGFSYVNPGHSAAALVVSRVSGLPFAEFVQRRLLAPAGIDGIAAGQAARDCAQRSDCHVLRGDGRARRDVNAEAGAERPTRVDPFFADHAVGGTGVWMSPRALSGWLSLHLGRGRIGERVLVAPAAYQQLCVPHVTVPEKDQPFGVGPGACSQVAYGLGWFCTRYRGHRVLHHGGAEIGANAHCSIAPDAGWGVAVVTNAASPAADVIGLTLMDLLLGLPQLPWSRRAAASHPQAQGSDGRLNLRRGSHPAAALQEFAGRYSHAGNGPAHISVRGALLEVRFPDAPRFDSHLHPLGGPWFSAKPRDLGVRSALAEPARFSFEDGRATGFSLPGFGTWRRG